MLNGNYSKNFRIYPDKALASSIPIQSQDSILQPHNPETQSFMAPLVSNNPIQPNLILNQAEMVKFLTPTIPQACHNLMTNPIGNISLNAIQQPSYYLPPPPQVQQIVFVPAKQENIPNMAPIVNISPSILSQIPISTLNIYNQKTSSQGICNIQGAHISQSNPIKTVESCNLVVKTQKPTTFAFVMRNKKAQNSIASQPILNQRSIIPELKGCNTLNGLEKRFEVKEESEESRETKATNDKDKEEKQVHQDKEQDHIPQKVSSSQFSRLEQIYRGDTKDVKRRRKNERSCYTLNIRKLRKRRLLKRKLLEEGSESRTHE